MGTIKPQNPVLNRNHPFTQGLVTCLSFHEGAGTVSHDVGDLNNDATLQGALWTGSEIGHAVSFDGTDQYLSVANHSSLNFDDNDFSVAIRFKIDEDNGQNQYIVAKNYTTGEPWWGLLAWPDQTLSFYMDDGTNFASADSDIAIEAGRWYDVVVARTGDTAQLYVNGIAGTEGDGTGTVGSLDSTAGITLGLRPDLDGETALQGQIAIASIYNRAVTASEAAAFTDHPFDIFRSEEKHGAKSSLILGSQALTDAEWSAVVANNEWHHIAIIRHAEGDTAELYIDATSQGTVSTDLSELNIESLVIGQNQDEVDGGFSAAENLLGKLDEFTIYNRLLTAAEIQILADNGELSDATYEVEYYHHPEADGGVVCGGTAPENMIFNWVTETPYAIAKVSPVRTVNSNQTEEVDGGAALGTQGQYFLTFPEEMNDGARIGGAGASEFIPADNVSGGIYVNGTADEARLIFPEIDGGAVVAGELETSIGSANAVVVLAGGSATITAKQIGAVAGGAVANGKADTSIDLDVEGGVELSGESKPGFYFDELMAGGSKAGGAAHEDTPGRYYEIGSGGAVVNGEASATSSETRFASGGVYVAGLAPQTHFAEFITSGSVLVGGGAVALTTRSVIGENGVEVSGSAVTEVIAVIDTSGGCQVNGAALLVTNYNIEVSGGVQVSGSITINSILQNIASGGVVIAGKAIIGIGMVMDGGVLVSGQPVVTFYNTFVPSGGAALGGEAPNLVQIDVEGGCVVGGEHVIEVIGHRYWVGDGTSTDWDNIINWSTASGGTSGAPVPNSEYHVYYDSGGSGNCTLETDAFTKSVLFNGYAANFDADTYDIDVDGTLKISNGNVDLGDGTWTVGGNLTLNSSNITYGTSVICLDGTSIIYASGAKEIATLKVPGQATYSSVYILRTNGDLDVDGTLEIASGTIEVYGVPASDKTLKASGTITGAGTLRIDEHADTIQVDDTAVWDNTTVHFKYDHQVPARTWLNDSVVFDLTTGDHLIQPMAGTHTFLGNVSFNNWTDGTFDMGSYNPNFVFYGDIIRSAYSTAPTWAKGDGAMSFLGNVDQTADFDGFAVEDWIINKIGGGNLKLASDATADSFDALTGGFDVNAQNFRSKSLFRIQEQADLVKSGLNNSTITADGDAFLYGKEGDLMDIDTTNDWIYNVGGLGQAFYVKVGNSNASGGSTIYAYLSEDAGDTQNWKFPQYIIIVPDSSGLLGNGSYDIYMDHVWRRAYCGEAAYTCRIKQRDEYCEIAAFYRNRGTPVLRKNLEEPEPQEICGNNYQQSVSECSVGLVAPIIFCRLANELKVLDEELTHTEDQYRPKITALSAVDLQTVADLPEGQWQLLTDQPFKPLSQGTPVKHAPPKVKKAEVETPLPDHLLSQADLRRKYADNYEKLKKPVPSVKKETTVVRPTNPKMTALHRQNEKLKKKKVSTAAYPTIPAEIWDILRDNKAAKQIKKPAKRKAKKMAQAL
jgi:hypothetical protein